MSELQKKQLGVTERLLLSSLCISACKEHASANRAEGSEAFPDDVVEKQTGQNGLACPCVRVQSSQVSHLHYY